MICVPTGCFVVADASLSHKKHPLRCRVSSQHDGGHEGVAQSPLQSTILQQNAFSGSNNRWTINSLL
ncbi:hypothetical protein [Lysinibacillus sp. CTST325]